MNDLNFDIVIKELDTDILLDGCNIIIEAYNESDICQYSHNICTNIHGQIASKQIKMPERFSTLFLTFDRPGYSIIELEVNVTWIDCVFFYQGIIGIKSIGLSLEL